jgi:hypothetical protein
MRCRLVHEIAVIGLARMTLCKMRGNCLVPKIPRQLLNDPMEHLLRSREVELAFLLLLFARLRRRYGTLNSARESIQRLRSAC